jgi:SAM-dependent methyltransferase
MNCPVCSSVNSSNLGAYRSRNQIFKGAYRLSCESCGLVYISPFPSDLELRSFNEDYFFQAHGDECSRPSAINFSSGLAKIRLNHLKKFTQLHNLPILRVLEFGPGSGYFAKYFLEQNQGASYLAVETDTSCHPRLNSLGVEVVDVNDIDNLEGSIDLVVMSHVLEHVSNPNAFLGRAYQMLKKGGFIFIEVPCMDFLHKDFDEPHLLFFDKKSLETLLGSVNFKLITTSYHGVPLKNLMVKSKLIKLLGLVFSEFKRRSLDFFNGDNFDGLTVDELQATFKFYPAKTQLKKAWWLRAVAFKE